MKNNFLLSVDYWIGGSKWKKNVQILLFTIILIVCFIEPITAAQIELKNGKNLRGKVENDIIKLQTEYASLNIQSKYLNRLNRKNDVFIVRAAENNRFEGKLINEITFITQNKKENFSAAEIKSLDFDSSDSFNSNRQISLTLKNRDFFFANTVEDRITINTSLGSSLNLSYDSLVLIEYLPGKDSYLIKRKNNSDIKADLSGQKIIIWPAAAEIIEVDFSYIKKINFN